MFFRPSSVRVGMGIIVAAGLGTSVPVPAALQPPTTDEIKRRALVVTFSDGRVQRRLLTASGGRSWTPHFPRRADAPDQQGLKLAALQIDHVVQGSSVSVSVSLRYGSPTQKIVPVATVSVVDDPVTVTALESFGVDSITLSIGAMAATSVLMPATSSVSSSLDVSLELAADDVPQFTVAVRNDAPRAVMAIAFRMHRDGKIVGSGRYKTNLDTPLIAPTALFRRTLPVSGSDPVMVEGAWTPRSFDTFEITGVLWDDGLVEGDQELGPSEAALASGRARQLDAAIAVLRRALSADPPMAAQTLRLSLEQLTVAAPHAEAGATPATRVSQSTITMGMQQVKDALLKDLETFEATPASESRPLRGWIADAIARYQGWRARIVR